MKQGNRNIDESLLEKIRGELSALDEQMFDVNGRNLKASQCYHFGTDPLHILFNTNCPQSLKEKIESIISKYTPYNENSA